MALRYSGCKCRDLVRSALLAQIAMREGYLNVAFGSTLPAAGAATNGPNRCEGVIRCLGKAGSIGLRFPLFSVTRKVAECPKDRHVVPGYPPLGDLSIFDAEHCPEIKLRLATRRRKWAYRSLLRALIRGPYGDEIPLGNQQLDRLDRIGKNRRILPQKFLDLIKTPNLDPRRCFAMADNIRCD
jgi:hypothetical protein